MGDSGFNPAEAEEGFRRKLMMFIITSISNVSIQPKPKKGLEVINCCRQIAYVKSFNPAEAEEGFRRLGTLALLVS